MLGIREVPEDWEQLRQIVSAAWLGKKVNPSHVNMSVNLLHDLLVSLYGTPSILRLTQESITIPFLCESFAQKLNVCLRARGWAQGTNHSVLSVLRMILAKTKVSPAVVRATRGIYAPTPFNRILGKKHGSHDSPNREMLESWIARLREKTTNKSDKGIRTIMCYLMHVAAKAFGVALEEGPTKESQTKESSKPKIEETNIQTNNIKECNTAEREDDSTDMEESDDEDQKSQKRQKTQKLQELQKLEKLQKLEESKEGRALAKSSMSEAQLIEVCRTQASALTCGDSTKLRWLKFFVADILMLPHVAETLPQKVKKNTSTAENPENPGNLEREPEFDGDKHRISREDLEKIEKIAVKDTFNELFFRTLLTTGMRVGGYVCMRTRDIADVDAEGKWVVRAMGKTIEKGSKYLSFEFEERARELMARWLNKLRACDPSPYVFPGRKGHHIDAGAINSRFKKMCREIGLESHVHALRHCFGFMVWRAGNSIETVAKLMRHQSVTTTTEYYLKQSTAEVTASAIIPWLRPETEEAQMARKKRDDPIPSFLKKNAPPKKRIAVAKNLTEHLRSLLPA